MNFVVPLLKLGLKTLCHPSNKFIEVLIPQKTILKIVDYVIVAECMQLMRGEFEEWGKAEPLRLSELIVILSKPVRILTVKKQKDVTHTDCIIEKVDFEKNEF